MDRIAILDARANKAGRASEPVSPEERAKWPKTVDEAVERLLTDIPRTDQQEVQKKSEEQLAEYHFGLGIYIRNSYGLWRGNEALLPENIPTTPPK
jgi:hypothetical protein